MGDWKKEGGALNWAVTRKKKKNSIKDVPFYRRLPRLWYFVSAAASSNQAAFIICK